MTVPHHSDRPGTVLRLRELWSVVLQRSDIEPESDFFDLGGDSLTGVELMARVRAEFRVDLGAVDLFDHPTLDTLAGRISRRAA